MAFGVGDELSVRVSANTQNFERGMNQAENSLNSVRNAAGSTTGTLTILQERADETADEASGLARNVLETAASLQILGNRADDAADETSRLGRVAAVTSGSLSTLAGGATASQTALGGLSLVLVTSAIPALITVTALLSPLIATVGGLAAAVGALGISFATVAGTGLVAFNEQTRGLAEALENLRAELTPIIVDFGEQFIPLIQRTIEALPGFVESLVAAVGPMDRFSNQLLTIGGIIQDVGPDIVETIFDLAREALPIFISVVEDVRDSAGPAFEVIMDTTREMIPLLSDFGEALLSLLPELNEFGVTAARVVVPALTTLVDALTNAIEFVNTLDEDMSQLVAAFSLSAPAIAGIATSLFAINPILGILAAAVGGLWLAWKTNFNNIRKDIRAFVAQLRTWFNELKTNVIDPFISGFESTFENNFSRVLNEARDTAQLFIDTLSNFTEGDIDIPETAEAIGEAVGMAANRLQEFTIALNNLVQGDISLPDFSLSFGLPTQEAETVQNIVGSLEDLGTQIMQTGQTLRTFVQTQLRQLFQIVRDNREEIRNLGNAIGNALAGAIDIATELQRVWRFVFETIVAPVIRGVVDLLDGQFGPTLTDITDTINHLGDVFREVGNFAQQIWSRFGDEITTVAQAVGRVIQTLVVGQLDFLLTTLRVILELIQGDFGAAWQEITALITRQVNRITKLIEDWEIVTHLQNIAQAAVSGFISFFMNLPNHLTRIFGQIIGVVASLGTRVFNSLIGVFNQLALAVDNIFTGIANSIIGAINQVISRAQTLISAAPQEIQSQLPTGIQNIQTLSLLEAGENIPNIEPRSVDQQQVAQTATQALNANVNLNIQGDSQLAEIIQENAEVVVEDRERQVNRNSGTQSTVVR